jgi:hypothetical protein
LQQLFAGSQGYQPYHQTAIPQVSAPQYPGALTPSPDQAAQATAARMLARTPVAAPVQEKPSWISARRPERTSSHS